MYLSSPSPVEVADCQPYPQQLDTEVNTCGSIWIFVEQCYNVVVPFLTVSSIATTKTHAPWRTGGKQAGILKGVAAMMDSVYLSLCIAFRQIVIAERKQP